MAQGVTGTAPPSPGVPRVAGGIVIGPAVGEGGGVVRGGGEQGGFIVKPSRWKVAEKRAHIEAMCAGGFVAHNYL